MVKHGATEDARFVSRLTRETLALILAGGQGSRLHELTDWRRQVYEHRSQLIVRAAVAGFALGGLMMLRRRR